MKHSKFNYEAGLISTWIDESRAKELQRQFFEACCSCNVFDEAIMENGSMVLSNGQPIVHIKEEVTKAKDRLLGTLEKVLDEPTPLEMPNYSYEYMHHFLGDESSDKSSTCDHKWEDYFGLSAFKQYRFCTKCDLKDHNL